MIAPQLTAMNGPAARVDSVVHEPRDALLARAALAGDEDRRVDLGDPARQVHDLAHGGALGDDAQRLVDVGRHADQRAAVIAELTFGCLQRLRDPVERDVQALLEALRLEEAQLLRALVAPLLPRATDEVAPRITLAQAAVFEDVDFLAGAPADVAAGEAADRPAHGHV